MIYIINIILMINLVQASQRLGSAETIKLERSEQEGSGMAEDWLSTRSCCLRELPRPCAR